MSYRLVRRARFGVFAVAVAASVLGGVVAAQDTVDGLRDQREQGRRDAASVAAELDALSAQDQELVDALAAIDAHIALQETKVATSRVAVADAERQAGQARQRAQAINAEIAVLKDQLRRQAIDAFVSPKQATQLDSSDLVAATLRQSFLDQVLGDRYDSVDLLRTKVAEQEEAERAAADLLSIATHEQEAIAVRLAELDAAKREAEELRTEVRARIATWETESAQIAAADRAISAEIRRLEDQARKAAEEAARKQAEADAAEKARLEAEAAAAENASGTGPADGDDQADDDQEDDDADDDHAGDGTGEFTISSRPVPGRVTSPFGDRVHPIFGTVRHHYGIDFDADSGDPIGAAAAGTVLSAGWINGYGNTVVLLHPGGYTTLYAHQSNLNVVAGQSVQSGELIGWIGSTGWSTGSHLHFELRLDGAALDPAPFL